MMRVRKKARLFLVAMLGLGLFLVIYGIKISQGVTRSQQQVNSKKYSAQRDGERKIVHYRNPMNPEIISEVPMKDDMGMDYVAVYEDELSIPQEKGVTGNVSLGATQVKGVGIETVPVRLRHLLKEIRTVGKIAYDPKLVVAQTEFISALQSHGKISEGNIKEAIGRSEDLVESSRRKLRLLGMSQGQIEELEGTRDVQDNLVLPERTVWVYADVYEFELSWVKEGQESFITTTAFPGEQFKGTVRSISPTLDPKTHSATVRMEIDNPDIKLMPGLYVEVVIKSMYVSAEGSHMVLAIPREAVIDTGIRRVVWVDLGDGKFQGRNVKVGPEVITEIEGKMQRYLPVLDGLEEGVLVVTKGNFLVDSQSQLTGEASSVYGGALEAEGEIVPTMKHAH
ncbi:MAG: efflux RND transporter periplasmic adaptor subunit [bacterium]